MQVPIDSLHEEHSGLRRATLGGRHDIEVVAGDALEAS
jgi:hypothetical protein